MTKKDYIKIASVLKNYNNENMDVIGLSRLIQDFAKVLAEDNPKFNFYKFNNYILLNIPKPSVNEWKGHKVKRIIK